MYNVHYKQKVPIYRTKHSYLVYCSHLLSRFQSVDWLQDQSTVSFIYHAQRTRHTPALPPPPLPSPPPVPTLLRCRFSNFSSSYLFSGSRGMNWGQVEAAGMELKAVVLPLYCAVDLQIHIQIMYTTVGGSVSYSKSIHIHVR